MKDHPILHALDRWNPEIVDYFVTRADGSQFNIALQHFPNSK